MNTHAADKDLATELGEYLGAFDRLDSYQLECVLKDSPAERTEKVWRSEADGKASGPFVRKEIDAASGIGGAYLQLYQAQQAGAVFSHLPRIYECERLGEKLVVVMEWVDGETLEVLVARVGASVPLAMEVFPRICDAVGELHRGFGSIAGQSSPVIHRDLKPSNVMALGFAGQAAARGARLSGQAKNVCLIDLGIARTWHEGADADTVKFGTRSYAPPEQFGFGQTSVRSDVYALGALLYYLCEGRDPESGLTPRELLQQVNLPKAFASIIERAMSFDPAARYESAAEMQTAFIHACAKAKALDGARAPWRESVTSKSSAVRAKKPGLQPTVGKSPFDFFPTWVGKLWNVAIVALLLFMILACYSATVEPTPENARLPLWFRALEYLFMMTLWFCTVAFILLDKRRLRARFVPLQGIGIVRSALYGLLVVAGALMITLVVGFSAGLY